MFRMTDRNDNGRGAQDPRKSARSEPEIIPPEEPGRTGRAHRIWISFDEQDGTRRIYVARPGPFTIVLALAILALIAAVMLIVLLSVALIWIPVVIVLIVAFVLSVTFRQYWWRFRNWLSRR
jgi:ABC-type multidrug transport system fused ATPase/permease subunit